MYQNAKEREKFLRYHKVNILPSQTNFVFVVTEKAQELYEALLKWVVSHVRFQLAFVLQSDSQNKMTE